MFVQLLFRSNLILFQISGIFPCYYDDVNKRWYSTNFIKIYSVLVFVFLIIALVVGIYFVSIDMFFATNRSNITHIAGRVTCVLITIDFIAFYTHQLKNVSLFIEFANDLKFIYEEITSFCQQSTTYKSLLKISVKLTLSNILNGIITFNEMKRMSQISPLFRDEILYKIFYFGPNFVLLMLPTIFYCLELFVEQTMKQFNSVLAQIIADSSVLIDDDRLEQRKMFTM